MKHSSKRIIGIATAYANGYAESEVIKGAIELLHENSCTTVIISDMLNFGNSMEVTGESRIYDLIHSEHLDALMIITESFHDVMVKRMIADMIDTLSIPVIAVGSKVPEFSEERCYYMNTDDVADMMELTSHLIEEHGFSRIDLLTGQSDSEAAQRRKEGYIKALKAHGIEAEQRIHYGDFWFGSGEELAARYISGELPMPQAVICANCYMAFALLKCFAEAGISVPEQVSVVSYDYSDERILYTPLLTCYRRNRRELGRRAAETALCMIRGEAPPIFDPPLGEIVLGKSCPCTCDPQEYYSELIAAQKRNERDFFTLFNEMELKLTESRKIDDFAAVVGSYQWMIQDAAAVWLCLHSNWYDLSAARSNKMECRCVTSWLDNTPFYISYDQLDWLPDDTAAYYCLPIFVKRHYMGYAVLQYNAPVCYDDFLRYWLKTTALALENLRMKTDLHYLLHCQTMSDNRDNVTGTYSEKGIRQLFGSFTEASDKDCLMALLKLRLFERTAESFRHEQLIHLMRSVADDMKQLCRDTAIIGYTDNGEFVFLFGKGNAAFICDAIYATVLQNREYISEYGVDSFVCSAEACCGRSYDAIYTACSENNRILAEKIKERRDNYRYKQLSELRTSVYLTPLDTFAPVDTSSATALDSDTFRHSYKKCFGISFQKDRINARLYKCKHLLLTTAMTTTEIAELCGYSDSKFFLHQFTKFTGMTPIGYRGAFDK